MLDAFVVVLLSMLILTCIEGSLHDCQQHVNECVVDAKDLVCDEPEQMKVAITQQIDLSGPVGRMVASVMFGLAEIELEYRRERQQAGITVAKTRGVYQGRPRGTTKAKPTRARQLRKQGFTIGEIANALDVSERSVFWYLD